MSDIVYRGTLTKDKLKTLFEEYFHVKSDSDTYNPHINQKAISIILQEDGNWKGEMFKFGRIIKARTNDPQTVLTALITGQGE